VPLTVASGKRKPGSAKGRVWIGPDFDRTPDDFGDYVR
jgi:hypothetical protein